MTRHSVCDAARRFAWIAATVLGVLMFATIGAPAADETIPRAVHDDIEAVLRKKVTDLLAERDKDGIAYKRGAYSKTLRKIDDATYQVAFSKDTIEDAVGRADQIKTERFVLTVKKDASGKWTVAKEDLADTYIGLYRALIDRQAVYKFDAFSFEHEGLKVTASNGYMYRYLLLGKPFGWMMTSDDLRYEYAPPRDAGIDYYQVVYSRIARQHPDDIVFKPERLRAFCDPTTCDTMLQKAFTGLSKLEGKNPEGGAGQGLGTILADEKKDEDKELKDDPFAPFIRAPQPDRRYWNLEFKRQGARDHFMAVSYDNWAPFEVTAAVSGYGALFSYYAEDVRKSGIPPYELEHRDDEDARDYRLDGVLGRVDLALEDAETIDADLTFSMTSKRELKELPFAIARFRVPGSEARETKNPKLQINSVQDADGHELTFVKRGGFGGLVAFPKPVPAGTAMKLRVQFTNQAGIYKLNPAFSYLPRGGWLPFVRVGQMIPSFDLTVRTPDKFKVLGVGQKLAESKADGVLTTRWGATNPVDFPTVIFGDYFEDGPGIKATKSDGTEIPVRAYVDTVSMSAINAESIRSQKDMDDVMAQAGSGASDIRGKALRPVADQAVNALNLYRAIYGTDYPYGKLDLVVDPFMGMIGAVAQSPTSIVFMQPLLFKSEGAVATMGARDSTQLARLIKDTIAHETAHQWWGSSISNANIRNYWFVESLSEFSAALFVENVEGRKKYLDKVADWRKTVLDNDMMTAPQNGYTMWAGETGFAPFANTYAKGPFAFHMLRETFGDEKLFTFLKTLAQSLKGKEIITRDIQRVMEQVYGGNMDWFFDQWIRSIGIPQYSLNYTVRQTEDGKWLVQGTIRQRVVAGKYMDEMKGVYYRGVAPLTFVFADGKRMDTPRPILVQGAETPFQFKLPKEPTEVLFNAGNQILAQDILVNKSGW